MSDRPRFFDDLAGVAGGAMSALAGLRDEAEALMRARIDEAIRKLELVRREELDAMAEMAANARAGQEAAEARLRHAGGPHGGAGGACGGAGDGAEVGGVRAKGAPRCRGASLRRSRDCRRPALCVRGQTRAAEGEGWLKRDAPSRPRSRNRPPTGRHPVARSFRSARTLGITAIYDVAFA